MAKQTFTTGQVLTAAQMTSLQQTAMGGGSATAKTASYVLVAADAGTTVAMNSAGATTITVNTGLFAAGDTVFIQNLGAGACTVTAGTATVATAGSLILPQNDAGILYFTATGAAIFYDYIQAGAVSPLTTKGDVYTFSTSDARLAVGANNTVLTADSAEATGLKWATPSAGGMTLISETVASGNTAIDLTSIPGTYTQLLLVWSGIVHSNTSSEFDLRINNNTGSVYADEGKRFGNTTFTSDFATRTYAGDGTFGFRVTGASAEQAASGWFYLDNYASATKYKTYRNFFSWIDNSTAEKVSYTYTGTFLSTTAVTQLNIFRNGGTSTISNNANTSIRLYGIA